VPCTDEIGADDIATIVYTSGTTGNVVAFLPELFATEGASTLLSAGSGRGA